MLHPRLINTSLVLFSIFKDASTGYETKCTMAKDTENYCAYEKSEMQSAKTGQPSVNHMEQAEQLQICFNFFTC